MPYALHQIENTGPEAPWLFLGIFLLASALMIWRLEAISAHGFEGTVLGTLVMPYCSGIGNLLFTFIIARRGGSGGDVMTNSLVNNVTNMTLVIGLPAIIWGMRVIPAEKKTKAAKGKTKGRGSSRPQGANIHQLNRLSLLLTLTAVFFFTGATWVLGRDGKLNFTDGLILVGLFLFWQSFHVFEVLKGNVQQNRSFGWQMPFNLVLIGLGAYATYVSTDWLVGWVSNIHSGFISAKNLGWLSGWLMVLPNAILAFYYGWRRQSEVVYTSQVGDCHVSIPLCIGIYAVYHPLIVPAYFSTAVIFLGAATLLHFFFVAALGRLPRWVGLLLVVAYGVFLYCGLLN